MQQHQSNHNRSVNPNDQHGPQVASSYLQLAIGRAKDKQARRPEPAALPCPCCCLLLTWMRLPLLLL